MKLKIPLVIGRQSSGEAYIVNLAQLPNLFISYSNDAQLPDIFLQFIHQLMQHETTIQLSLSLSSRLAEQVKPPVKNESLFIHFSHADYEEGQINSIDAFIAVLMEEMKTRKTIFKKSTASGYLLPAMLVFIDNIFEVIMASQRKTAFSFIELLMTAAPVNMFFIMGSSGIYRNLLEQLMMVTPALKKKMKKSVLSQQIVQPLGAELVMNPDGLLFFRERNEKIHRRLYPFIAPN